LRALRALVIRGFVATIRLTASRFARIAKDMIEKLEPAKTVIDLCGGPDAVAEMTGRHHSNVRRWAYPEEHGGTNGLIPHKAQAMILQEARRRGIPLTAEHFFPKAAE
jgi:hypothetical protein